MREEEHHWQAPHWWYQEKRPATDEAYFENMCRVIFQAGLNWQVIDNKWPSIKKAFMNFNIGKIGCFNEADVNILMKDAGIIRNKGKIKAIIQNVQISKQSRNSTVHFKNTSIVSINQRTTKTQLKI